MASKILSFLLSQTIHQMARGWYSRSCVISCTTLLCPHRSSSIVDFGMVLEMPKISRNMLHSWKLLYNAKHGANIFKVLHTWAPTTKKLKSPLLEVGMSECLPSLNPREEKHHQETLFSKILFQGQKTLSLALLNQIFFQSQRPCCYSCILFFTKDMD